MSELPKLADLSMIFPSLHIDPEYVTADNITGAPIYREARCLLYTEVVTALAKGISIAQLASLQPVTYDTYRPQQAQAILWNACPDPQYVVDATIGSNHSRDTIIDVTLMDSRNHPLDMDADFNGVHDCSHVWYPSIPPAAQRDRLLPSTTMFGDGFVGINSEWWYFELPGAAHCPPFDDQIDYYTVTPITT